MSGKVIEFMKEQKYRFDFGTDDKLYVIIFNGKIPQRELKGMLESIQSSSFADMAEAIESYLVQHHLEHSNFNSIEIPLDNYNVMKWTAYLLHSQTYEKVDEKLEDADVYFSIMDFQKDLSKEDYKGCYFAMNRLPWGCNGYKYNVIAQTFSSEDHGLKEKVCFAIRESYCMGHLRDVISYYGEPVLPAFGCVDMMSLLPNLENFKTEEDVLKTAIK